MKNFRRLMPATLFGRAVLTLVFTFGLFAILTFVTIVYYALAPVAKRSAEDLAAFMVLTAQTWVLLPEELRGDYEKKLLDEHDLWLTDVAEPIPPSRYFLPYVFRVENALQRRLRREVSVKTRIIDQRRWFWLDLAMGERIVRVGFPRDRIDTRPLAGLIVMILISLSLVLLTAFLLARRITAPLTRLSLAAEQVARGENPNPLPESGPRELVSLSHQFNQATRQVHELLADRTVLLAGISHDLRTPLTRLRLAMEMLPAATDASLLQRMERDLEQMNELIAQVTDLGRNLGAGERHKVEVSELISDLVAERSRVHWQPAERCRQCLNPVALRRILNNLLDNAMRYSMGRVEVRLESQRQPPSISILDRGPGIPDEQKEAVFRPFYRLEHSRSRRTGGSGLGLAIARQLATANGFSIRLGNRHGGGTVARVELPIAECDGAGNSGHKSG